MGEVIGLVVVFVLYFLPALVASERKHPNGNAIGVLNLLLGWTALGWVIALVWALTGLPRRPCPHCSELIALNARWCPHCRMKAEPASRAARLPMEGPSPLVNRCRRCGKVKAKGTTYCTQCGADE